MKRWFRPFKASLVAASLALAGAAAGQAPPLAPLTVTGGAKATLQRLHDGNQAMIQMGQLAEDQGSTRAVRDYGRRLVDGHTLADRQIDEYMRKRGSDLEALGATATTDPDHELLATKSGAEFDHAFAEQMVADNQRMLDVIEGARSETDDDALLQLYDQVTTTTRADKRAAEDLLANAGPS